ncbi:MAG: 3-oxoacyl-ACP synthase III [Gemmataceae bacterium]|nr:3-oxoacyl-ACP synthase III [Gemmataceae bacterium]
MTYTRVHIDAIGYELPPIVVTSAELESRLKPAYDRLRLPHGQLEYLTGIIERRWWEPGFAISQGAAAAARKALALARVPSSDIEVLIYAGVCREQFEPATACRVAAGLDISPSAAVYDISNACLGVLNGMLDIANRIELGQIRAGLVVSCESAREINDIIIERLNETRDMEFFKLSLATLTGGSGAVAVLLTDGSFGNGQRRRLLGGVTQTAPQFHGLCRWGVEKRPEGGLQQYMSTDSIAVLRDGVALGSRTWQAFLAKLGWTTDSVDKIICHQVGGPHRDTIMKVLKIPADREFSTFEFLGNIGTVSLPLTAALAEERDALEPGDRVGFLGIGSGLNCLMLGVEW